MWYPDIQEKKVFEGEQSNAAERLRRRLSLDHFLCQHGGHCVLEKSLYPGVLRQNSNWNGFRRE